MPRKHRKNVGLIGLGIIGTRAAAGLRAAGFRVYVWNRTVKPAPNFLSSPAEIAETCDIIQIFVADARALMEVLEAMKEKLTAEHIVVCNATVGPEVTVEASKFVQATGARFLDAPFTGSKVAAERRQLVYYVGGDEATYLRTKPILEATSKAIVRVGGIGDAAILKVVTNMIAAVSIQALSEALALVKKAGLPTDSLAAALEHNAARSGTMDLKLPKMLSGDYETHFSLKHMFKDVQLGIQMANALEIETPTAAVTAGVMFGGINKGWGDEDFASVFKTYADAFPVKALDAPKDGKDPEDVIDTTPRTGPPETQDSEGKAGDATGAEPRSGDDKKPVVQSAGEEKPTHFFAKIFDDEAPTPPKQ